MSRASSLNEKAGIRLQRTALDCVAAALAATRLGEENPNRAAHLVRREMKRLRAILQVVPKPGPDWIALLAGEAAAIHRDLAVLRDGCVVEATLDKIQARHPRRWKAVLRACFDPQMVGPAEAASWAVIGERLEKLKTTTGAKMRGRSPEVDLGEALARTYRKARRARAHVSEVIDQEAVHAWRKALYRLYFQLQLAAPMLSDPARELEPRLASGTRMLGRCGDLALARARLESRQWVGAKARTRSDLLEWIEWRRQKIAREMFAETAGAFERRPRDFAKWCLH